MSEKTFVINGNTYVVDHLDPETSIDVFVNVVQGFAPAIAPLLGAGASEVIGPALMEGFAKKDTSMLLAALLASGAGEPALRSFVHALDAGKLKTLARTFRAVTVVRPASGEAKKLETEANYKLWFGGKFDEQVSWLAQCIKAEYSDFFNISKIGN